MGIHSWDDFDPDERDYFGNHYKKPKYEADNLGDLSTVLRNLEQAMKKLERNRFAQILSILIEKEIFE